MAVRARAAGATVRVVHARCQRHAASTVGRSRDVRARSGRCDEGDTQAGTNGIAERGVVEGSQAAAGDGRHPRRCAWRTVPVGISRGAPAMERRKLRGAQGLREFLGPRQLNGGCQPFLDLGVAASGGVREVPPQHRADTHTMPCAQGLNGGCNVRRPCQPPPPPQLREPVRPRQGRQPRQWPPGA